MIFKGSPPLTDEQKDAFFDALAKYGNVSQAAHEGSLDRSTAYDYRTRDDEFAKRWDDALHGYRDALRRAAHERAVNGTKKIVVSMGKVVMVMGEGGESEPLTETTYSDSLLLALLKAHIPNEFNAPPAEKASATIPADLQPDPVPVGDEDVPDNPIV